jgi:hypothetical protein
MSAKLIPLLHNVYERERERDREETEERKNKIEREW